MDRIEKVTCQIHVLDETKAHNKVKLNGPKAADEIGWPDSHPLAQADVDLGADPLQALERLYVMVAGMPAELRQTLARVRVDFNRGES